MQLPFCFQQDKRGNVENLAAVMQGAAKIIVYGTAVCFIEEQQQTGTGQKKER